MIFLHARKMMTLREFLDLNLPTKWKSNIRYFFKNSLKQIKKEEPKIMFRYLRPVHTAILIEILN